MTNNQEIRINEDFERNYDVELLPDAPNSTLQRYYFPPGVENSGPVLRVTSVKGDRFLAIVAGQARELRIKTWPNPDFFLAIPALCLVDTKSPSKPEVLPFVGHVLHYYYPVVNRGLVLVGHCCAIYCYSGDGKLWGREDLFCCEDPRIEVGGDRLFLTAHKHGDDLGDTPVLKTLNLLTGESVPS